MTLVTADHPDTAAGGPAVTDHHLPLFHIRPPRGYLNDPNGPVLIDGVQHLYFQYRLTTDMAEPVHWGHATSEDLVRWSLHRPAMTPDPVGLDRDGCWSGNAVVDDDGVLRAFYSGKRDDYELQSALVAESRDGGASFGSPRQIAADPADVVVYRDPFVWRERDGSWSMVLGAGDASGVASLRRFTAEALDDFRPAEVLASLPSTVVDGHDTGVMWECPQVLDVEGVRVVLVGAWRPDVGTLAVHAVLPGREADRLDGLGLHLVDHGPEFYAASVMRDSPDGPVVWGWVQEGRTAQAWRQAGWAGAISLPRVVRLGEGGRLLSFPHPALERARGAAVPLADGADVPTQCELVLTAPSSGGRATIRFGEEEWLTIDCTADGAVRIDRSSASIDPDARGGGFAVPDAVGEDGFVLRLFIDASVFELFTGTGQAATFRCYPRARGPWSLSTSSVTAVAYPMPMEA